PPPTPPPPTRWKGRANTRLARCVCRLERPLRPTARAAGARIDRAGAHPLPRGPRPVDTAPEPVVPLDAPLGAAPSRGDRRSPRGRPARFVRAGLRGRVAPDSVADLVQDVFVMAMSRLETLRDDAAFAPWLATIARRRAADWRRRRRDTVPLEEMEPGLAAEG